MRIFTLALLACGLSFNSYSQTQTTMAALRGNIAASTTLPYFITDAGREGLFYYDANDRSTADNAGTVIVSGTKRYKRSYSGPLDIRWFGGVADCNGTTGTDNTAAINAAFAAANKNQTVMIPSGWWYIKSTIALPLVTTKKVPVEVFGNVFFAQGSGFVVEGNDQDFRSYGMISGGNTGATTEAQFTSYSGTGVYLKNAVNSRVEVNEVANFRVGIMQAGDKNGGTPVGSQYNRIYFSSIHNNYIQIQVTIIGNTTAKGNWNNASHWYGGQLGKGTPAVTYGAGGWYGIMIGNSTGATPGYTIDGQTFHDVGFEGLERAVSLKDCNGTAFIGGGVEPDGFHYGFDFDPVTCSGTKIVGYRYLYETNFVAGRLGNSTMISASPFWVGDAAHRNYGGMEAVSISASRWMVSSPKYNYANFTTYNTNDLMTQSGTLPTLQAMTTRINGITRTVPFKSTFLHITSSTSGSPLALPPNIGLVRVEANQAKVLKVDTGDLVSFGEGFLVEYLSPAYPVSFVRADNGAVLIPATSFPASGTYRCTWAQGQYKVSRLSNEFKPVTQNGPGWTIADGTTLHYVNYIYGNTTTILPSAAAAPGRTITIKNMQAGYTVQVVGLNANDENLIQGRGAMTVLSDGTTWNVISFYKRNLTY